MNAVIEDTDSSAGNIEERQRLRNPCPVCYSHSLYPFCPTGEARQRFLCVVCGVQFVVWTLAQLKSPEPQCPECGSPMQPHHGYPKGIRFRCSNYPSCHSYLKLGKWVQ